MSSTDTFVTIPPVFFHKCAIAPVFLCAWGQTQPLILEWQTFYRLSHLFSSMMWPGDGCLRHLFSSIMWPWDGCLLPTKPQWSHLFTGDSKTPVDLKFTGKMTTDDLNFASVSLCLESPSWCWGLVFLNHCIIINKYIRDTFVDNRVLQGNKIILALLSLEG